MSEEGDRELIIDQLTKLHPGVKEGDVSITSQPENPGAFEGVRVVRYTVQNAVHFVLVNSQGVPMMIDGDLLTSLGGPRTTMLGPIRTAVLKDVKTGKGRHVGLIGEELSRRVIGGYELIEPLGEDLTAQRRIASFRVRRLGDTEKSETIYIHEDNIGEPYMIDGRLVRGVGDTDWGMFTKYQVDGEEDGTAEDVWVKKGSSEILKFKERVVTNVGQFDAKTKILKLTIRDADGRFKKIDAPIQTVITDQADLHFFMQHFS